MAVCERLPNLQSRCSLRRTSFLSRSFVIGLNLRGLTPIGHQRLRPRLLSRSGSWATHRLGEISLTNANEVRRGKELKGNTLRVYLHLLRQGPCELRDVQRSLGFSTPSLASYHLGRLIETGYAAQNETGRYYSVKDASAEILEGYTRIGAILVPQLSFFAVLFTPLIVFFGLESLTNPNYVALLVLASLGLVVVVWYETVRLWRRLTSWK